MHFQPFYALVVPQSTVFVFSSSGMEIASFRLLLSGDKGEIGKSAKLAFLFPLREESEGYYLAKSLPISLAKSEPS